MKFAIEVSVCGESQGVEIGESFADCVHNLATTIHNVPEQFPSEYIAAIFKALATIAEKVDEMSDGGDGSSSDALEMEMNGTISATESAGFDRIDVTFGDAPEED